MSSIIESRRFDLRKINGKVVGVILPTHFPTTTGEEIVRRQIENPSRRRIVIVGERGAEQISSDRLRAIKNFSSEAREMEITHIAIRIFNARLTAIENETYDTPNRGSIPEVSGSIEDFVGQTSNIRRF